MSKRHQASRRRSYGRRQHEVHERTDRGVGPMSWIDDNDLAVVIRYGDEQGRTTDWSRLRGLD